MKLLFQGKQVGKPRVRQYALLGNAWLEKSQQSCVLDAAQRRPMWWLGQKVHHCGACRSSTHHTRPLCCTNPVLGKVINSFRCRGLLLSWSCQAPRLSRPPAVSNLEATVVSHSRFYPQQLALDPTEEMPFQNLPVNKCAKCLIISFIPCKRSSF